MRRARDFRPPRLYIDLRAEPGGALPPAGSLAERGSLRDGGRAREASPGVAAGGRVTRSFVRGCRADVGLSDGNKRSGWLLGAFDILNGGELR